jgi:predicted ribosomally synthesized peptide with SipW-like signal peptide
MKKILGLTVAALLIMAMVGGGTWAFLTDIETSGNNVLTAGIMDLGLANISNTEAGGSTNFTWTSPSGWKPGDNVTAVLYVKNSGNIPMSSVNVSFAHVFTNGTPTTISGYNLNLGAGGTGNITGMIKASVATWNGTGSVVAAPFQGDALGDGAGTLSGNGTMSLGGLAPGVEAALRIVWLLNTTATNAIEGDSENITLTLTASQ